MSDYKEPYVSDVAQESRALEAEEVRGRIPSQKSPPPQIEHSQASSERSDGISGINDVSPEVINMISEKIKKEIMQELGGLPTINTESIPSLEQLSSQPVQRETDTFHHTSYPPSPPLHSDKLSTPPSPIKSTRHQPSTPPAGPSSSAFNPSNIDASASMSKERSGVRFRAGQNAESLKDDKKSSRPTPSGRTFSTAELTTIDQKWGTLFEVDREPTPRLGQVLKGLANHIVEEYEPKKSIVVTPSKMADFYSRFPLDKEKYDFLSIFQTEDTHGNLSRLYRDLHCEHHLIATHPAHAPTIPALTPNGFANWLTLFIVSYPDIEHSRLEKIVLDLPIDADGAFVDGKPERLPKQISRHLLPNAENMSRQNQVYEAISDFMHETGLEKPKHRDSTHVSSTTRRTSEKPTPIITQHAQPIELTKSTHQLERERHPYISTPSMSESAIEEDVVLPGRVKIERERQPYNAMPGSGKTYHTHGDGRQTTVNSSTRTDRVPGAAPPQPLSTTRSHRDSDDYTHSNPTAVRRESKAARDYAPLPRAGAPYRPPSPGIAPHPARNSVPTELGRSAGQSREDKYGSSFSSSTTFAPVSYASSDRGVFPSSDVNGKAAPIVIDPRLGKPRESHRDRERERDRDRSGDTNDSGGRREREREREKERSRERERERERDRDRDESKMSGRARRSTMSERNVPPRASMINPADEDFYSSRDRVERDLERDEEEKYSRSRGYDAYARY